MKKTFFLFALALGTLIKSNAQSFEYLDINQIKARFMANGDMFANPTTGQPSYEFPKGSGKHSNSTSSIWIGGIDRSTNSVKVAAQTYRQTGSDFWPGPLDEFNGSSIDSFTSANWSKVWKVNKSTIDSFRLQSTHTLSNTPSSILNWPGRGANSTNGAQQVTGAVSGLLNIPNREMAPFVDVNNDNIYNPLDGDYPDIKGEQMLWWVFNDKAFAKTNSGSGTLNIEIHGSAYACNQEGLNNTTFVNLRVYYWGTSIIDSVYIGLWNDGDLGYAFDDYIGYDSTYNMMVYYNGDNYDETSSGYGYSLTQTGVVMISGPRIYNPDYPSNSNDPYLILPPSSFTYYNNSQNPKTGDPSNVLEYYNYLTGSWKDGSMLMSGCNPSALTGTPANFVFPDDPSMQNGISEKTCNRPAGDRRTLLSSGPFKLTPGIVPSDITFAILNTDTNLHVTGFNELRRLADTAYKYADGCQSNFWPLNTKEMEQDQFRVYPNPANSFFTIEDTDHKTKSIQLYNIGGQVVLKKESDKLQTKIDTKKLPPGLYYLRITKDNRAQVFNISIQ